MEPQTCSKCGVPVANMRYDAVLDVLVFKCQRCNYEWIVPPLKKGKP
jgi:predicted Zn-ribbon and HTH transcriptional regulator